MVIVCALVLAATAPVQTGGLSAATAERGLSAVVADPEAAYLATDTEPVSVATNGTVAVAWVRNLLDRGVFIDVAVRSEPESANVSVVEAPSHLPTGAAGEISASVECPTTLTVEITATGRGVRITVTRTVQVRCA